MNDPTITTDALRDMLERSEPVTVLDVRRAEQRAEWAIPGSLHADVYDALRAGDESALGDIELEPDQPVVTVCNMGQTSQIAARLLRSRGLTARSLEGGMRAWSLAWNVAEVRGEDGRTGEGENGTAGERESVRRTSVVQVRRTGKGCLSYLIGSGGVAGVVDPSLAPETYVELAKARGLRIVAVLDTHVHADHLSRARGLTQLTGAELYLPDRQRVRFPFRGLADGDVVAIGDATVQALHTPGHTRESTCYLLDDLLFTGDTLFVGAVGRPDLKSEDPAETRARAEALYDSLERLFALPGDTVVLGGHTSEPIPFDGNPIAARLASVRAAIPLLREPKRSFVDKVLARIPPTPPNHLEIVAFNEAGEMPADHPTVLEAGANRCAIK
jgi:glyoxylase-like metal-dependent hydrolase (beta-lactamase superfamily II)/rhodanese-related sulfurtransferase